MTYRRETRELDEKIAEAKHRLAALKHRWHDMNTTQAIAEFGNVEAEIRELKRQKNALTSRERARAYFDVN